MSGATAQRVLDALRHDLLSGVLAPGARLTEVSLGERYAVSRVPVREALRTLSAEGYVDVRPNAGATVARISPDDVDDLYAVRATIEEVTARRCAARVARGDAGADDVAPRLRAVVDEGLAALAAGRTRDLPDLNTAFHLGLAELSGAISMLALLRQVADRVQWVYSTTVAVQGRRSWEEHGRIVEAVAAGDADLAGALAREHVERSRSGFLEDRAP